jgi:hypothetical protein
MSDVTQILGQIEHGDGQAAEKLLPLVYDEVRKLAALAAAKIADPRFPRGGITKPSRLWCKQPG